MAGKLMPETSFDLKLAIDCAHSFTNATGIGSTISDAAGNILHEEGYGCDRCGFCAAAGLHKGSTCVQAHIYGMVEAERFGGKYIYFCPMGLSCFVSPIVGMGGSEAKITIGPFLMVDREDYVAYDLQEVLRLPPEKISQIYTLLDEIQYVPPGKVHSLSNLLFMAVGFLNNVAAANHMLDRQSADIIQGQMSAYIYELKKQEEAPRYPLDTERALVESIARFNKPKAQELLNELLGFVLFSSGGDVAHIKTRIYELLVVISRAAIDAGASTEQSYQLNHNFIMRSQTTASVDELCYLINDAMNQYMDSIFQYSDIKHRDVIRKAVDYIHARYDQKISLEEVAARVYLSPAYFSKIFKRETGENFNVYLNRVRIEKSKKLLHDNMKVVEVSAMVGFEDQSYFSKVFKRITGVSPYQYKEQHGSSDT